MDDLNQEKGLKENAGCVRSRTGTWRTARHVAGGFVAGFIVCFVFVWMYSEWQMRDWHRRSFCLSNLKQLGLGLKQYAQEFDDKYPWSVGRRDPGEAWRDLGLLYPNYITEIGVYICPGSKDRKFEPMCDAGPKEDYPFEPLRDSPKERTSYGYCFDARNPANPTSWRQNAKSTVRLLADKKAGLGLSERSNHKGEGRHVLYPAGHVKWEDGHVKWKSGKMALDPEPEDDQIGAPDAKDYTAWWSDPPYYGE